MEVATNEALCPPSTQPRHALSQHDLGSLVLSSVQQTWFFCPQELAALWGEHLSQAHMPTEINSDTPGRSELNSILTPPIFFLLPPCLPLTSTEAILPPEPPAQANISKDHLGWKQFAMASAHFPGVYPSVPQPKAARDQSSAWGSLNTQLPKGSSTLKELQAPTQVEPGLPPRLYFYFAKSHTSRDRQTDRRLAGQGW